MSQSPRLAADIIIEFPDGDIILIRRGVEPYKESWALPGGGVEIGETVEQAAIREAKEETGLDIQLDKIVGVYSDPRRDPRGHTVSIVFHAKPIGGTLSAATDACDVIKTGNFLNIPLAFDHGKIVKDLRKKSETNPF